MKKGILVLTIFSLILLTGCDPNRDFLKTCKQVTKSTGYEEIVTMKINYNNKDELTNVTIERNYNISDKDVLNSIKKSSSAYNKTVEGSKGIGVETSSDENFYKVVYNLNVPEMSDTDVENFDLRRNSIKYFNYLKKNNIECS